MGASEIVEQKRNLPTGSREADKCAFSEARPGVVSRDIENGLDQTVVSKDSVQVSSVQQSSESSEALVSSELRQRSSLPKQSTCLESNIVVILTLVFAIVIKGARVI